MKIKENESIPNSEVFILENGEPVKKNIENFLKNKKKYDRKKYNAATGSNLKAPQPGGGPRTRSFCARFKGMKGPMKKPNGKPTRKALAMRRWKC